MGSRQGQRNLWISVLCLVVALNLLYLLNLWIVILHPMVVLDLLHLFNLWIRIIHLMVALSLLYLLNLWILNFRCLTLRIYAGNVERRVWTMNCPPISDLLTQKDSGRLIDLGSLIHVNKYLYIWHLVLFHMTTVHHIFLHLTLILLLFHVTTIMVTYN